MVYSIKSNDSPYKDISYSGSENRNQTGKQDNKINATNTNSNDSALTYECGKTINGEKLNPVHVQRSVKISRAKDGRSVISFEVSKLKYEKTLKDFKLINILKDLQYFIMQYIYFEILDARARKHCSLLCSRNFQPSSLLKCSKG